MLKSLAMFVVLFAAVFAAIGVSCSAQTKPLGTPKEGITKGSQGKDGQEPAKAENQNHEATNASSVVVQVGAPNSDTNSSESRENLDIQRKLEWFTGLLVLVGAVQGGTMIWQGVFLRRTWTEIHSQADLIKRQADLMEDTAKKQLRAYLCISESLLKFTEDGFLEAQLYLKNGGQTPAYKVKTWSTAIIREYQLAQPLRRQPENMLQASGIIPPQDKHIIIANKITASDIVMQSLNTQNFALYAYGEATYEDIFGKSHTLEFRLIYGGPAGTRTKLDTNGVKCGFLCMDTEGNEERDTHPQPKGQNPN